MAEWQIGHRKSSLVLSARFPVVKCTPPLVSGIVTEDFRSVVCVVSGSRSIFRAAKTENPIPRRSSVFRYSETTRKRLLRRLARHHWSAINHFLTDLSNSPKTLCESLLLDLVYFSFLKW